MCKKISYESKNKAKIKGKELKKNDRKKRYSYYCNLCKSFHLTRQKNHLIEPYFAENSEYEVLIKLIRSKHNSSSINNNLQQFDVKIENKTYIIIFNKTDKSVYVNAILE